MKRSLVLFSVFLVLGVSTVAILAEVQSNNGLPVDGEITGWVTEIIASEAGVDLIAFGSETEPYEDLFITNGAGDLDQFGDLLIQGLVNVTLKGQNVWCCWDGLCRKVPPGE